MSFDLGEVTIMEENNCIENDFLGEKEVHPSAYYGIQTLRAVENFPTPLQAIVFIRV